MAQGRGGSRRPRHWSCRRGRSAHAACKHAVRVPASATRTATPSTCAQIHLRRVWPNAHGAVLFPPCTPEHYARQLHGSGHTRPLASAENVQETNTRLHAQARQIGAGAVAARAHRRCLCAYRRQSDVGYDAAVVSVKMTVCNKWVAFFDIRGNNILKTVLP